MAYRYLIAAAAAVSFVGAASAATINVGNHVLQYETAGQQIELSLADPINAFGLGLNLEVGGALAGPLIEAIDLKTGTIFPAAWDQTDVVNLGLQAQSTIEGLSANLVPGRLALLTFDTTNVEPGEYSLSLLVDFQGTLFPTTFYTELGNIPATFAVGTLTVVPEPVSLAGLLVGGMLLLRRRVA
jgi:hypothetical protein